MENKKQNCLGFALSQIKKLVEKYGEQGIVELYIPYDPDTDRPFPAYSSTPERSVMETLQKFNVTFKQVYSLEETKGHQAFIFYGWFSSEGWNSSDGYRLCYKSHDFHVVVREADGRFHHKLDIYTEPEFLEGGLEELEERYDYRLDEPHYFFIVK